MSIAYTPSGTYPSFPITLPQNGEVLNETILTVGILEPIIDAIGVNAARTWIAQQTFTLITSNGTPGYKVSSRTETRIVPIDWQIDSGFTFTGERWVDGGTAGRMSAVIRPPNGQTLTAISLWLDPAPHAALPATPPQFEFQSINVAASTAVTVIATKVDNSALGTYVDYHEVAMTGLSTVINATALAYRILLDGESGADSANNLQAYGWMKLVYTRTSIGED